MSLTIPAARRVSPLHRVLATARAAGIPARAVAEEAGISTSMLSMVASGDRRATPDIAARLAEALGVPVAELFPETTHDLT